MDAQTAAALANSVAHLNILYLVLGLCVLMGAFTAIVALGERAVGFDIRKFIDNVEKRADKGDVWRGVALVLGIEAVLCVVLWVGLR